MKGLLLYHEYFTYLINLIIIPRKKIWLTSFCFLFLSWWFQIISQIICFHFKIHNNFHKNGLMNLQKIKESFIACHYLFHLKILIHFPLQRCHFLTQYLILVTSDWIYISLIKPCNKTQFYYRRIFARMGPVWNLIFWKSQWRSCQQMPLFD